MSTFFFLLIWFIKVKNINNKKHNQKLDGKRRHSNNNNSDICCHISKRNISFTGPDDKNSNLFVLSTFTHVLESKKRSVYSLTHLGKAILQLPDKDYLLLFFQRCLQKHKSSCANWHLLTLSILERSCMRYLHERRFLKQQSCVFVQQRPALHSRVLDADNTGSNCCSSFLFSNFNKVINTQYSTFSGILAQ